MNGALYSKCSKIWNTLFFLFSNKLAGMHKMVVRIANREDPDQTASSEAVCSESALFVKVLFGRQANFRTVNVLKFRRTLFSFCSQRKCGLLGPEFTKYLSE